MVATLRDDIQQTEVLRDELPPLVKDEIRLRVDKVGLSANNLFYIQMGEAPFLKFFSVYPLEEEHKHLANMPAWGVATVMESANSDIAVGEQFTGFLQMANVVQMKAKRTAVGYTAYGEKRDKLNQAYNNFTQLKDSRSSPLNGSGVKSDLAMTASPGALSGFILYELLLMKDFYACDSVVLTSASSKLSLATALLLQEARENGAIKKVIGYTSDKNLNFVSGTGLYDDVLTFDQDLPGDGGLKHILIDVAGDASIYKRNQDRIIKALAVGGTHGSAEASTFTAFGPSGFLKMFIDMVGPKAAKRWASKRLNPRLEMFFAPTVINELLARWGQEAMDQKSDAALQQFVDAAIDRGWISVTRSEDVNAIQSTYQRIVSGQVPPSEAVIISLIDPPYKDK
jgi:hypothetical protein